MLTKMKSTEEGGWANADIGCQTGMGCSSEGCFVNKWHMGVVGFKSPTPINFGPYLP